MGKILLALLQLLKIVPKVVSVKRGPKWTPIPPPPPPKDK